MVIDWQLKRPFVGWLFTAVYILLAIYSAYWLVAIVHAPYGWDFHIYTEAYQNAHQQINPYEPYHIGRGFLNHPAVLLFIAPLQNHFHLWQLLTFAAYAFAIYFLLTEEAIRPDPNRTTLYKQPLWMSLLLLTFAPQIEALYMGQLTPLALLGVVLAFRLSQHQRPWAAGGVLALAIICKTSPAILLLYFLIERRWRVLLSVALALGVLNLFSTLFFYPTILQDYVMTLMHMGSDWHPVSSNLAISAFLFWLTNGRAAVLLAWRILFFILLLSPMRSSTSAAHRFGIYLTLMVIFSPLVWYHHFLFFIWPFVILTTYKKRLAFVPLLLIQAERLTQSVGLSWAIPSLLAQLILLCVIFVPFVSVPQKPKR